MQRRHGGLKGSATGLAALPSDPRPNGGLHAAQPHAELGPCWTTTFVSRSPIWCPESFVGEIRASGADFVLAGAFGVSLAVVNESCHSVDIKKDVDSVIVGCLADVQDWVMVLLVDDDDADRVFGLVDDRAVGGNL